MKIGLLFSILLSFVGYKPIYYSAFHATTISTDSIPTQYSPSQAQQRYRFHMPIADKGAKRMYTVVVQAAKLRLGNEVTLPVGVDERTVVVRSGETILRLWDDYVFIPEENKLRILDENALKSERLLKISYERLPLMYPN